LTVAGDSRTVWLPQGTHTLTWSPGRRRPRTYLARLTAVDLAGNRGPAEQVDVAVLRDREPPELEASLTGSVLRWSAVDEGTPWLRLRLVFGMRAGTETVALGTRPHAGVLRVRLPRRLVSARLVASDSSGNTASVRLL
jgi:hypothetical protein